ncbi:MAG: hypothetical protein OEV28_08125 [Nitrospirota bacterium]|nr:hypothetical protein [Nitrospirota bacterium]
MRRFLHRAVSLLVILLGAQSAFADRPVVYTRYNIHVWDKVTKDGGHEYHASYANYTDPGTGHFVIPAGSTITVLWVRNDFKFRVESDKKEVDFEFHSSRMGMSVEQYIEKITSPTPVTFDKLSELDSKGIAEGKALVGMSKEGVMTALGYPATHRTPTLDSPAWVYWTNRFKSIAVTFDKDGKVVKGSRD